MHPTYEDAADAPSSPADHPDPAHGSHGRRDWPWFSTTARVTSGVKKVRSRSSDLADLAETLVLSYVTIPAASSLGPDELDDPAQLLQRYSVREFVVRRWSPARMRD